MQPYYTDDAVTLYHGDALATLREMPAASVDCCVTSPPYFGLRDYGQDGQYGLEASPAEYVENLRALFAEVRRVLADDGTLWLNLGDGYANASPSGPQGRTGQRATRTFTATGSGGCTALPSKNLMGIPWRVALALQEDLWVLRNDIVWAKQNGMPTSVKDRLSSRHEHIFLLTKSARYWFDLDAIREPHTASSVNRYARPVRFDSGHPSSATNGQAGKSIPGGHTPEHGVNPGDVWSMPTQPFAAAHFAVMPLALAERCVQAGCKPHGTVLDPFSGSGTTGLAAARHGRRYVGIDLSQEYLDLSLRTRLAQSALIEEPPA